MKKYIFVYSLLFCSLYTYYLKKWDYSKDWPQGWAVAALSMLGLLFLIGVQLMLVKFGLLEVENSVNNVVVLLAILLINTLVFLRKKRWKTLIYCFNERSEKERLISNLISAFLIVLTLIFYFYQLLSFKN